METVQKDTMVNSIKATERSKSTRMPSTSQLHHKSSASMTKTVSILKPSLKLDQNESRLWVSNLLAWLGCIKRTRIV